MIRYVGQRFFRLLLQILAVLALVFILFRLVPGNPYELLTGGMATPAQVRQLTAQMGWNQPLVVQLGQYLNQLLHFNLGTSLVYSEPVTTVLATRLPATLVLTGTSMALAILLGVPSGLLAAVYPTSRLVRSIDLSWILLLAIPNFWLALLLVQVFAVKLHWLPVLGYGSPLALILPSLGIGARLIALIAQVTRASILETYHQPYIQVAKAKGLTNRRVLLRHALKPAALPILTMIGLQTGYLLGGSVIIETIFAYPGIGQLMMSAINTHDYALLEGITLTFVSLFLLVNLIVDLSYAWVDPRIHYA